MLKGMSSSYRLDEVSFLRSLGERIRKFMPFLCAHVSGRSVHNRFTTMAKKYNLTEQTDSNAVVAEDRIPINFLDERDDNPNTLRLLSFFSG